MKLVTADVSLAASLPLRGNDLAVDFVNTVSDVRTGAREYLPTPSAFLAWALHSGALAPDEHAETAASLAANPRRAALHHRAALELRASLTRVLTRHDGSDDIAILDRARRAAVRLQTLQRYGDRYELSWARPTTLLVPTGRVAVAAAALITSERVARLSQCDGPRCGWLFVDDSPGHRRRWCSMQDCGNRDKVRRFRGKTVEQKPAS
jgi:predicted RNA-binding Zn ribbon-like protein